MKWLSHSSQSVTPPIVLLPGCVWGKPSRYSHSQALLQSRMRFWTHRRPKQTTQYVCYPSAVRAGDTVLANRQALPSGVSLITGPLFQAHGHKGQGMERGLIRHSRCRDPPVLLCLSNRRSKSFFIWLWMLGLYR